MGIALIAAGVAYYVTSTSSGTLAVQIRDTPLAWSHLLVSFSEVSVHPASAPNGTGWILLSLQTGHLDFLALGTGSAVLATGHIAAGAYSSIRVLVSAASGVLASGAPVVLSVTNGIIEVDTAVTVRGATATTVTFDFNLTQSITQTSAGWAFSPVLGPTVVS